MRESTSTVDRLPDYGETKEELPKINLGLHYLCSGRIHPYLRALNYAATLVDILKFSNKITSKILCHRFLALAVPRAAMRVVAGAYANRKMHRWPFPLAWFLGQPPNELHANVLRIYLYLSFTLGSGMISTWTFTELNGNGAFRKWFWSSIEIPHRHKMLGIDTPMSCISLARKHLNCTQSTSHWPAGTG